MEPPFEPDGTSSKKQVNSIERGNKYDFVRKCASDVKMNSRYACGYIK